MTRLQGQGKSLALQRALTGFGAEKSFEQASRQLQEHYGVESHRSRVREVVVQRAERAAALVDRESRETIDSYASQISFRSGEPWLIMESDGSMVRAGELAPHPAGGVSPVRGRPKRIRRTRWREVRLSLTEAPGSGSMRRRRVRPKGWASRCCPGLCSRAAGTTPGCLAWETARPGLPSRACPGEVRGGGGLSQAALPAGPLPSLGTLAGGRVRPGGR